MQYHFLLRQGFLKDKINAFINKDNYRKLEGEIYDCSIDTTVMIIELISKNETLKLKIYKYKNFTG